MNQKGDAAFMTKHLIGIILGLLFVLSALLLFYTLWESTRASERASMNEYYLMGDMLQGLINTPLPDMPSVLTPNNIVYRDFTFPFKFGNIGEKYKPFKGTILTIMANKSVAKPLPYTCKEERSFSDVASHLTTELKSGRLSLPGSYNESCNGVPCLCYSTYELSNKMDLKKLLKKVKDCRVLALPEGVTDVDFQFDDIAINPGRDNSALTFRFEWNDCRLPGVLATLNAGQTGSSHVSTSTPSTKKICIKARTYLSDNLPPSPIASMSTLWLQCP